MAPINSSATVQAPTITLRLSKWHAPTVCTDCGETIPAGIATRHYFEDSHLMVICRECAKGPAFAAGPSLQGDDACPVCGSPMEDFNCFNLWCPVGFENVQREVGAGPEPELEPEVELKVVAA